MKHVLLACQLLFGHVSIQNEINMHARERANVAALLTLRVDVLSARMALKMPCIILSV